MNKIVLTMLSVSVLISVSGCSDVKKEIGLGRNSPDEFSVVTRAPLTLPPEYNLTPPKPGEERVLDSTKTDAKTLIFSTPTLSGGGSVTSEAALGAAENALLQEIGANSVSSDIRTTVDRESGQVDIKDPYLGRRLLFWNSAQEVEAGEAIDPLEEKKLLEADEKADSDVPAVQNAPIVVKGE